MKKTKITLLQNVELKVKALVHAFETTVRSITVRVSFFGGGGSEMGNGAKITANAGSPVTILKWHGLQLKIRVEVKAAFGSKASMLAPPDDPKI